MQQLSIPSSVRCLPDSIKLKYLERLDPVNVESVASFMKCSVSQFFLLDLIKKRLLIEAAEMHEFLVTILSQADNIKQIKDSFNHWYQRIPVELVNKRNLVSSSHIAPVVRANALISEVVAKNSNLDDIIFSFLKCEHFQETQRGLVKVEQGMEVARVNHLLIKGFLNQFYKAQCPHYIKYLLADKDFRRTCCALCDVVDNNPAEIVAEMIGSLLKTLIETNDKDQTECVLRDHNFLKIMGALNKKRLAEKIMSDVNRGLRKRSFAIQVDGSVIFGSVRVIQYTRRRKLRGVITGETGYHREENSKRYFAHIHNFTY